MMGRIEHAYVILLMDSAYVLKESVVPDVHNVKAWVILSLEMAHALVSVCLFHCACLLLLHLACGGCSQALIDRLLLLVDNMQSAINFLSESDIVCNSNQFNQLRNKALSVMVSTCCAM